MGWLTDAFVTAACLGIGALAYKLSEAGVKWIKARSGNRVTENKEKQKLEHADDAHVIGNYREYIEMIEIKFAAIETKFDAVEKEHVRCLVENGRLQERVSTLEKDKVILEARINNIEQQREAR